MSWPAQTLKMKRIYRRVSSLRGFSWKSQAGKAALLRNQEKQLSLASEDEEVELATSLNLKRGGLIKGTQEDYWPE